MRLIDADAIHWWKGDDENGNPVYIIDKRDIDKEPTSYSVENVVAELEENASRYTKKYVTPYGNNGYRDVKAISIHKAIEIVKQGDVSDDFCEWKQSSTAKYKTSCGYRLEEYFDTKACYCKQCGKKIEVVE